jgi:hypothetical protein
MERFTAKSALLTGVDLIRRRSWLVILWAAMSLALTIVFAESYAEFMARVRPGVFSQRTTRDGFLLAYSLAKAVISLVLTSVLWASALRAILRPAERRRLGFGPEELCVLGAWIIPEVVVALVSAPVTVVIISERLNFQVLQIAMAAVAIAGLFWSAVGAVWAFGKGQVAPIRCWTVARGRFWLLAGLVVGVAVLERLGVIGVQRLARAVAFHIGPVFAQPSPPTVALDPGPHFENLFEPAALLRYVLESVLGALQIAFLSGIVASAYRAAAEPQAASVSTGSAAAPS